MTIFKDQPMGYIDVLPVLDGDPVCDDANSEKQGKSKT
jgi:hypothetical protein